MNLFASDPPRFTCRVARSLLSVFGHAAGDAPRGPGAGHVAGCPDCQRFFNACDELDLALTRDAARQERHFPAGLEQGIIAAVHRSAAAPRPARGARSPLTLIAFAATAGCAALAVVFAFVLQKSPPPAAAPGNSELVVAIDGTHDVLTSPTLPDRLLDSLSPATSAMLSSRDPLQTEVDAITADARSALRFLALNFLPSSFDPAATGTRSGTSGG